MRALLVLLTALNGQAVASPLPSTLGECTETTIAELGINAMGAPGGGSTIRYENGGNQISFYKLDELETARVGDPVRICLVFQARNCQPGDERGRVYKATNLRTDLSWEAPDSLLHDCAGA
jgi:hypothetical protein